MPAASGDPNVHVSLATLDRTLVRGLELGDDARLFYLGARAAGLRPPARFGSEVVARLLGLRKNHEAPNDALELLPNDPARAEAAYSAARILRFGDWQTTSIEEAAAEFVLPVYTQWQRKVLQTAVNLIGYPYVWGGTSSGAQTLFGVTSRGGFDCSLRLAGLQASALRRRRGTGRNLRGRTAAQMAGEVPRAKRIPLAELQPGDVMFGHGGRRAKAAAIDHAGIYLGGGWMINSSRYGVALAPVENWSAERSPGAAGRSPKPACPSSTTHKRPNPERVTGDAPANAENRAWFCTGERGVRCSSGARILTLMISVGTVWDLIVDGSYNWNW